MMKRRTIPKIGMYNLNSLVWSEFKRRVKREKKVKSIGKALSDDPHLVGEFHRMFREIRAELIMLL